jgi:hypothetical protein
VPHISLVFARCGRPQIYSLSVDSEPDAFGLNAVVSHISQKTSEMWGTQELVVWKELEKRQPFLLPGVELAGADVLLRSIVRGKLALGMQSFQEADQRCYFCRGEILPVSRHVSAAL